MRKQFDRAPVGRGPRVSVIINTDNRRDMLAVCLQSLRYLEYPDFEVVVVVGPTPDGSLELCQTLSDVLKIGTCPERNLSLSRNIAIAMSAGEIVVFLDDDSVPEAELLQDLVPHFDDPTVAAAGGFLYDHTGKAFQWRFGTVDRFGEADTSWDRAAPELNFPYSAQFPHVMANSAFRRSALVEMHGFDEEYEYFLDESDLICRLVDAGWQIAQLDCAFVHHKYMPSNIRNNSRVLTSWYSVIKNKLYFSILNNHGHASMNEVLVVVQRLIDEYRAHVHWAIEEDMLDDRAAERFETEVEAALRVGLRRGLEGTRRLAGPMLGPSPTSAFHQFPIFAASGDSFCWVLLTRTYPPGRTGGVGRYIHALARSLAAAGDQVHVLTAGQDHDRVDFEDGVWVHRLVIRDHPTPTTRVDGHRVPAHIWNYSQTMLDEAHEVATKRSIDAVYAPVWDGEGVAFVIEKHFPVVTSLQTSLTGYMRSNPNLLEDRAFMGEFVEPMLRIERLVLTESTGIHAISRAIVSTIETDYGFRFPPDAVTVVPLGLDDWAAKHVIRPPELPAGHVRICFIGRLELRKGIDVMLAITPELLRHRAVWIDFVGDDTIASPAGPTFREEFLESETVAAHAEGCAFHGEVDEPRLRGFYRSADIVVAPSRFESFGLVAVEAMMYAKPVVACRTGGVPEVVDDGRTGLLAVPGDQASLLRAIETLIDDPSLRKRMGAAGRRRYEEAFTPERMAAGVQELLVAASASASALRRDAQPDARTGTMP